MLTEEEQGAVAVQIDELKEHLRKFPFSLPGWDVYKELREADRLGAMIQEQALGEAPEGLEQFTREVPLRDGHKAILRIVRPSNRTGGPLVVLIHGGGFIMGDNVMMIGPGRPLADLYGAVVVSLQYRFAPENPWPMQPQDCYDELKWCAANAASIGADPSKGFILGGTSAGGNISAVCAQRAADDGLEPPLTGLWQHVTFLFNKDTIPEKYREAYVSHSQSQLWEAPILGGKDVQSVIDLVGFDFKSPWFSPANSETAHKGIPRTFFQASGLDPLRDDTLVYEDMLRENGVDTQLILYPGVPHAFGQVWPMLKVSKKWRCDFVKGIGWLLNDPKYDGEIQSAVERHPQVGGN